MGIDEDIDRSLAALERETSLSRLLNAACAELARLLGAPRATVSRAVGDLLVELSHHDGAAAAAKPLELFLIGDYPLTREVLDSGEPRRVVADAPDADPAEAALLRRFGFRALVMLPLRSRGETWGLVEIYGERPWEDADVERAAAVVERVGDRLAELERSG